MAQHQSLAQDLFEDMGRKVAEASAQDDNDDSKVVDEIESLCMNCHENVRLLDLPIWPKLINNRASHDSFSPKSPSFAKSS